VPHPSDFRQLAARFASAESDEQAHELFNAVFGLQPARHAHLTHLDEDLIPTDVSWAEAPPVKVPPRLRRTDKEYLGVVGKVRNVRRRNDQVEHQGDITTNGPVRISRLQGLDDEAFGSLLDLLSRALASPPDDSGTRMAGNGRVEITLRDARGWAELQTPRGTFTAPDFLIDVRSAP
jgi:uncharacterized protein (TIGR02677 family)